MALEIYQEIYYFDFDFSLQELFIKLAYLAFWLITDINNNLLSGSIAAQLKRSLKLFCLVFVLLRID